MSLFSIKTLSRSLYITVFLLISTSVYSMVYVYEVTTKTTRFQTVSRLQPDAFMQYNGGPDIIYRLEVLGIYPNRDYDKVMRDYGFIDSKNDNQLLYKNVPKFIPYKPYYWWR